MNRKWANSRSILWEKVEQNCWNVQNWPEVSLLLDLFELGLHGVVHHVLQLLLPGVGCPDLVESDGDQGDAAHLADFEGPNCGRQEEPDGGFFKPAVGVHLLRKFENFYFQEGKKVLFQLWLNPREKFLDWAGVKSILQRFSFPSSHLSVTWCCISLLQT